MVYAEAGQGIFAQSDQETDDLVFNSIRNEFGMVMIGSWPALQRLMNELNSRPVTDSYEDQMSLKHHEERQVRYKVLFLTRHGYSYDNLGKEIYGPQGWEDYWSKQTGDGNIVWGLDPELTPLGVEQAKKSSLVWKRLLKKDAPIPQAFYVSPFTRALETLRYTWTEIETPNKIHTTTSDDRTDLMRRASNDSVGSTVTLVSSISPPLVIEDLRGPIGIPTCARRIDKGAIESRYPGCNFEKGFTEEDMLWTGVQSETPAEINQRTTRFLDYLFEHDWDEQEPQRRSQFISVTTHGAVIKSLLGVVGHRPFKIPLGSTIPVLVKATQYKMI